MTGSPAHRRPSPGRLAARRAVAALLVAAALFGIGFGVAHAVAGGTKHEARGHQPPPTEARAGRRGPGHLAGATTGRPRGGPRAGPSSTLPSAPDPLGAGAASYLAGRAGQVQAAVEDLLTHQVFTLGPSRTQDEASVVKVDILAAFLHRLDAAGQTLDPSDQALATSMIEESDNDAATALWNALGAPANLADFDAAAGMTSTTPSSCVECPGFPWPGWGLTTTSATDQLTLLRNVVEPSTLLTPADRAFIEGLMEHVDPSEAWGVSAGVPAGVTVALKNGWLPLDADDTDWQINSIGWVDGLGRDYLVAVLTTGNPTEQYGIDTIEGLSTLIWQALAPPAGAPDP